MLMTVPARGRRFTKDILVKVSMISSQIGPWLPPVYCAGYVLLRARLSESCLTRYLKISLWSTVAFVKVTVLLSADGAQVQEVGLLHLSPCGEVCSSSWSAVADVALSTVVLKPQLQLVPSAVIQPAAVLRESVFVCNKLFFTQPRSWSPCMVL